MVLSAHFSEHRWKWKMVLSSSQRKRHRDDQRSPAVGINSPQIGKISPELCLTFFPPNVLCLVEEVWMRDNWRQEGSLPHRFSITCFSVYVVVRSNCMTLFLLRAHLLAGPPPISPGFQGLKSSISLSCSLWNVLMSTIYPLRHLPITCSQSLLLTYFACLLENLPIMPC